MASIQFSTENVDYLQRNNYIPPPVPSHTPMTSAPLVLRRLWHMAGVGQNQKSVPIAQMLQEGTPTARGRPTRITCPARIS